TARVEREATRDQLTTVSLARLGAPDPDRATFQNDARFVLDALPALTTRPDQIRELRETILNLGVLGRLVRQDVRDEEVRLPPLRQFASASGMDDEVFERSRHSISLPTGRSEEHT